LELTDSPIIVYNVFIGCNFFEFSKFSHSMPNNVYYGAVF